MTEHKYLDEQGTLLLWQKIKTKISGEVRCQMRTTAEWNAQPFLITQPNKVYIYTDYGKTLDGRDIMGIKFGYGKAYLKDIPFIGQDYRQHAEDLVRHITDEQRRFWNNKVTAYEDSIINQETLILSKN